MCEKNRNVSEMTKGELFVAINDKSSDSGFVAACIKEEDRRINEFIRQCIKEGRNAGG
jgi:hypothetical protein